MVATQARVDEFEEMCRRVGVPPCAVNGPTDPAQIVRYLHHLGERTGPPAITRVRDPVPVDIDPRPPDDWP